MENNSKLFIKIQCLLREIKCPRFLHHFGPKKYKFVQHAIALLMKEVFRLSFRRVSNLLGMLEIKVPTYSALCKSRRRIPFWIWNSLLKLTAKLEHNSVAVDSTGFSLTNPSFHYIKRIDRKNPIKSYVKLSAFFDLESKKFIALRIRKRPRHDMKDVNYLLKQNNSMKKLYGDKGYDAESLHEYCFNHNIQTIIPKKKNIYRGFYRRKQQKSYSDEEYHQRSLIESGFGSLKRKYGGFVFGKNISSIRTEIYCKAICHNLSLS
jgi:transposase